MGRQFGSKLGYAVLKAVADGIEVVELANRKPSALLAYGLEDLRTLEAERARRRIRNTKNRLQREGLIEKSENNGRWIYRLTSSGNERLFAAVAKPPPMPPGWKTIVSFDIPEKQSKVRQRFRTYLKRLDFRPMQRSVWFSDRAWTPCLDGHLSKSIDLSWLVILRAERLK